MRIDEDGDENPEEQEVRGRVADHPVERVLQVPAVIFKSRFRLFFNRNLNGVIVGVALVIGGQDRSQVVPLLTHSRLSQLLSVLTFMANELKSCTVYAMRNFFAHACKTGQLLSLMRVKVMCDIST